MISTDVKDRAIELWDGSVIYVTRKQEEALYLQQVIDAGGLRIDGNFISLKAVKKTGDAWEYAKKAGSITNSPSYRDFSKSFSSTRTKRVDALDGIVRGIKRYVSNNPDNCENAKIALAEMDKRLSEAKSLTK